jgi:hypothetical protein
MSDSDIDVLEKKNNDAITALLQSLTTTVTQAPPPTQVEDVEKTIIVHEPNKTIRFKLNKHNEQRKKSKSWPRRKAKRDHTGLNSKAKELMKTVRRETKLDEKRIRRRERIATMAADSAATSTCIREIDAEFTDVSDEESLKRFANANGTISKASKKTKLRYDMREPATDGDIVPDLAQNSLLSTSKCADANYITVFTPEEVKVFDAEAAHSAWKER